MIRLRPGRTLLAGLYTLVVYALGSLPPSLLIPVGLPREWLDLGHVPLFAGWTWVTLSAVVAPPGVSVILVTMAALVVGAADEWLQVLVPGRVPSLSDLRADALGVAIGIALHEAARRGYRRFSGGGNA